MKNAKLFIWTNFCSDYTEGLAFAIARNESEARKMIKKEHSYVFDWGKLEIRDVNVRVARAVSGGA